MDHESCSLSQWHAALDPGFDQEFLLLSRHQYPEGGFFHSATEGSGHVANHAGSK